MSSIHHRAVNGKELALGSFTVAAGLLNAYLWRGVIFAGEFKEAVLYSLPVLALFTFAILFSLSAAFIRDRLLRTATAVLALSGGYLFVPYNAVLISGAIVTALGGWYAEEQIANEYATSNSFSTRKILRSGLPVFFTTVAFVLAVFYFSFVAGQQDQVLFPRSLFDVTVPFLESPLQGILPGFRPNASVDDMLLALAARELGGAVDISKLGRAEREGLLAQGRKTLSEQFGLRLTGRERVTDILYQVTNVQVAKFLGPYQRYLPFLAAAGFFIAVKAFTLPVYWLTLILVFGVVKLLVAASILKREMVTISAERLHL